MPRDLILCFRYLCETAPDIDRRRLQAKCVALAAGLPFRLLSPEESSLSKTTSASSDPPTTLTGERRSGGRAVLDAETTSVLPWARVPHPPS